MALPIATDLRPPLVLALDLAEPPIDPGPTGPLERLRAGRAPVLRETLDTLEQAAEDAQVKTLVVRIDDPAHDWATAQELRDALHRFRASGKRVVAHADSLGERGDGTLAYAVAAACDEIHVQALAPIGLLGIAKQTPFLRRLLDKLDVVPQLEGRHEYKSARNLFTEEAYTDAHREADQAVVTSLSDQLVAAIAEDRGVSTEQATAWVDQGQWLAPAAKEAGLIDRCCYRDETVAALKRAAGPKAKVRTIAAYRQARRRRPRLPRRGTRVAVIHAGGAIALGRSRQTGLMGPRLGADTLTRALRQALRDDKVEAVVLRVDSPGGSATASDAIAREVVRLQEAGKPVVVSMAGVAGSGGYWIAMDADRIVAQPGTITGSIGVVMGKLVDRKLRERLGVTYEAVTGSDNATMFSSLEPFSEAQRAANEATLDHFYDAFVDRAARARGLDRDELEGHARGRVWTGADAQARGLVDALGGYPQAYACVRQLLGLADDARLRTVTLPRTSVAERLSPQQPELTDAARSVAQAGRALGDLRAQLGMDPTSVQARTNR